MVMSWPSVQHKLTGPTSLQLGGTQTWELVLDMVREEVIDVRRGGLITRGDGQPAVLCHMTVGSEQQRLWWPLSSCPQLHIPILSFSEGPRGSRFTMLPGPLYLCSAIPAGACLWVLAGLPRCPDQVLLFATPLVPWWSLSD